MLDNQINATTNEKIATTSITSTYKVQTKFLDQEIIDTFKLKKQVGQLLENAIFHHMFGMNLFYEKQYKLALKQFTIANNYAPNNPSILIRIADTYTKLKQPELAQYYKQKAIALDESLTFLNKENSDD